MGPTLLSRLLAAALLAAGAGVLAHQAVAPERPAVPEPAGQFGLPFAGPPGPASWLFGQRYGNTVFAYRKRQEFYGSGQGLHFGLDFRAPCGTPVLAIGDGRVVEVDGPHGSPPHNLVIDHGNGLHSLYGHLREPSGLAVGARVKRGETVGRSGDSEGTCLAAPHLHLELRDASHNWVLNPMPYIGADWASLALVGAPPGERAFQVDAEESGRWRGPLDQPDVRIGGPLLNGFSQPWPPAPGER